MPDQGPRPPRASGDDSGYTPFVLTPPEIWHGGDPNDDRGTPADQLYPITIAPRCFACPESCEVPKESRARGYSSQGYTGAGMSPADVSS